jgi:predicted DNA-binding ribbon-helix-helix protein
MPAEKLSITLQEPVAQAARGAPRRRRLPRRKGHRARLTVPESMWRELTSIAQAAGTTPNDVLIRLASERLRDRQRAVALRKLANERWRAFADASSTGSSNGAKAKSKAKPLTAEDLVKLSQASREDG